jgi:hypothetical protein
MNEYRSLHALKLGIEAGPWGGIWEIPFEAKYFEEMMYE